MNLRETKIQITLIHYVSIFILVSMILAFSLTMVDINYFIQKYDTLDTIGFEMDVNIPDGEVEHEISSLLILNDGMTQDMLDIVSEMTAYTHMPMRFLDELDDLSGPRGLNDVLLISGRLITNDKVETLSDLSDKGYHIIMTSIPNLDNLSQSSLDFLGIRRYEGLTRAEEVRLLGGFLLGGLLELEAMPYDFYPVVLSSSTRVFADDNDEMPLIWRNSQGQGQIYVNNTPFFESVLGYGLFSAILSDLNDDFMYPVVNAFTYTYRGMPFLSNENLDVIMEVYNRESLLLQHDILVPDVLALNKSRALVPTNIVTASFQTDDPVVIRNTLANQLINFEKDFNKLDGTFAYEISGRPELDRAYIDQVSNYFNIQSLYDHEGVYGDDYLSNDYFIDSIIRPWQVGDMNLRVTDNGTTNIPITYNEIHKESHQVLELYSMMTAFGYLTHHLDLEHVIYPIHIEDNWIGYSKEYTEFIDLYNEYFDDFDKTNAVETSKKIRAYLEAKPRIKYYDTEIHLQVDNWQGRMSFILRTDKELLNVRNGTATKIEEGSYLIRANSPYMLLELKPVGLN